MYKLTFGIYDTKNDKLLTFSKKQSGSIKIDLEHNEDNIIIASNQRITLERILRKEFDNDIFTSVDNELFNKENHLKLCLLDEYNKFVKIIPSMYSDKHLDRDYEQEEGRCVHCNVSVNFINNKIENHSSKCYHRTKKEFDIAKLEDDLLLREIEKESF